MSKFITEKDIEGVWERLFAKIETDPTKALEMLDILPANERDIAISAYKSVFENTKRQ